MTGDRRERMSAGCIDSKWWRKSVGAYLFLSRRIWVRLPGSLRRRLPGRAYGRHLHALVCRHAERKQNHSTFFLRNRAELELMCRLADQRPPGSGIHIAVLGCSKGAEVYSILWAIRSGRPDLELRTVAIDISGEILEFAREGVYLRNRPAVLAAVGSGGSGQVERLAWNTFRDQGPDQNVSMLERMTEQEIGAMFELADERVRVRPWLKQGITWVAGDASDPELVHTVGPQDIVVANRFLCHMAAATAEKCLRNVAQLVKPGGYLFVSGVDVDLRTRVARDLGWEPIQDLMREVHEGDRSLTMAWPLEWWGLEPFSRDLPDWRLRYASVFRIANTR